MVTGFTLNFNPVISFRIFADDPDFIIDSEELNTETVVDYQVRGVKIIEEDSEFTKEEIVSIIEEHPENKLW